MKTAAEEIRIAVDSHLMKFADIDDATASVIPGEDKWSLKEIMGHLVDSASNNHQRIVRLQTEKNLVFPPYHYSWNKIQRINSMAYGEITGLWKYYNYLLAHIISNTDSSALGNIWDNGKEKYTLEKIITWYVSHMKDHLAAFEERLAEIKTSLQEKI